MASLLSEKHKLCNVLAILEAPRPSGLQLTRFCCTEVAMSRGWLPRSKSAQSHLALSANVLIRTWKLRLKYLSNELMRNAAALLQHRLWRSLTPAPGTPSVWRAVDEVTLLSAMDGLAAQSGSPEEPKR